MQNLNEKLKQAAEAWAIKKDYSRPAMPEVLALNKEYRAANPDQYPYNAAVKDFIVARAGVSPEYIEMLKTEIYLSQQDIENEIKEAKRVQMIAAGWRELNKEAIDEALKLGKKLQVSATATNDWATIKIDNVYKPHIFNGNYGLMKPRARSRGYYLHQFENAFCKLV